MLKWLAQLLPDDTSNLWKRYRITDGYLLGLLYDQQGMCAICGVRFTVEVYPCVDHCHGTGRIRGVLCARCNAGIGLLGDSPFILKRAIKYLEEEIINDNCDKTTHQTACTDTS